MSTTWLVILAIAIAAVTVIWYFATFNAFVRLRNLVEESWNQVDTELQRRHDLIPNLVATVTAAVDYERDTVLAVTWARERAEEAVAAPERDIAAITAAEEDLGAAVRHLTAVAEQYPELRAVGNFLALQTELGDTEDRVAASRRLYNGNVRALNTRIESVPARFVARAHHVPPADYFQLSEPSARTSPDLRGWRSGNDD